MMFNNIKKAKYIIFLIVMFMFCIHLSSFCNGKTMIDPGLKQNYVLNKRTMKIHFPSCSYVYTIIS